LAQVLLPAELLTELPAHEIHHSLLFLLVALLVAVEQIDRPLAKDRRPVHLEHVAKRLGLRLIRLQSDIGPRQILHALHQRLLLLLLLSLLILLILHLNLPKFCWIHRLILSG
jgi:hypothetical protein